MQRLGASPTPRSRFPSRLLITAAAIAALSTSALAAGHVFGAGPFFQDFFAEESSSLTPGQVEVMDQMGRTFEEGVTSNGTTMTPLAALADENVYYLRLRIDGPAEVVLPDLDAEAEGFYQLFAPSGDNDMTLTPQAGAYDRFGYTTSLSWLEDSDPADNSKEVVIRFLRQNGSDMAFNDNVSKLLTIRGLWVQSPGKEYTQVLDGDFSFDIGLHYESRTIPLDCQGLVYHNKTYGVTNVLERLELSPLSLSYQFWSTLPEEGAVSPSLGPLQIFLKDGTPLFDRVILPDEERAEGPADVTFRSSRQGCIVFDTPLDLSLVDYVQYGSNKISVDLLP